MSSVYGVGVESTQNDALRSNFICSPWHLYLMKVAFTDV